MPAPPTMDASEELGYYRVLLECARSFAQAMDFNSLIDEILDRSREVIRAEACSVFLPDKTTRELILYSTHENVRNHEREIRIPPGKGIVGVVFESKKSLNIKDAKKDPRHFGKVDEDTHFETRSLLTIPLLNHGECIGVMQALNPIDRDFFSDHCIKVFEDFGILIVNTLVRLEAQQKELDQARANEELRLAREIQESFLPDSPIRFGFCELHLKYFPAREVGGDFYFAHQLNDSQVLMGLGDVSGKGVPASLTMSRTTAMIKALSAQATGNLGEWVSFLNRQLCPELKAGRFIAITFLLADANKSEIQICAAGQYPPLLCQRQNWKLSEAGSQIPVGILEDFPYSSESAPLKPGQYWLLFSDGVTEARNARQEEMGLDYFQNKLPAGMTARDTLDNIIAICDEFSGSSPQHDDASLLILDWRGLKPESVLQLDCRPETLCDVRDFIERWSLHAGYDDASTGLIVMAADEAASNVFRHAYDGKAGALEVRIDLDEAWFSITLADQGKTVSRETIKGRDLDDIKPGGLGTVIMQKVFDETEYDPREKGTRLTMRKRLPA